MRAGVYEHYKGERYLVLGSATDSSNTAARADRFTGYVVYVSLRWPPSGGFSTSDNPMHVRDSREFSEKVCAKRGCPFYGDRPATPKTSEISPCTERHPEKIQARFKYVGPDD